MLSVPSRRSRAVESDDEEEEESRSGTSTSVGRNDTKRSRRSREDEDTPASTPPRRLANGLSSVARSNKGKQAVTNGAATPKLKHQPGAIVRVKLTNFVTYTSAEFFPGPNLNIVEESILPAVGKRDEARQICCDLAHRRHPTAGRTCVELKERKRYGGRATRSL